MTSQSAHGAKPFGAIRGKEGGPQEQRRVHALCPLAPFLIGKELEIGMEDRDAGSLVILVCDVNSGTSLQQLRADSRMTAQRCNHQGRASILQRCGKERGREEPGRTKDLVIPPHTNAPLSRPLLKQARAGPGAKQSCAKSPR